MYTKTMTTIAILGLLSACADSHELDAYEPTDATESAATPDDPIERPGDAMAAPESVPPSTEPSGLACGPVCSLAGSYCSDGGDRWVFRVGEPSSYYLGVYNRFDAYLHVEGPALVTIEWIGACTGHACGAYAEQVDLSVARDGSAVVLDGVRFERCD